MLGTVYKMSDAFKSYRHFGVWHFWENLRRALQWDCEESDHIELILVRVHELWVLLFLHSLVPRLISSSACEKSLKPLTSEGSCSMPPIRLKNKITWLHDYLRCGEQISHCFSQVALSCSWMMFSTSIEYPLQQLRIDFWNTSSTCYLKIM